MFRRTCILAGLAAWLFSSLGVARALHEATPAQPHCCESKSAPPLPPPRPVHEDCLVCAQLALGTPALAIVVAELPIELIPAGAAVAAHPDAPVLPLAFSPHIPRGPPA